MSWMLRESSHSHSEISLALMGICYCICRTQQLCPRPDSVLRHANGIEKRRAPALCMNLEPRRKSMLGSLLRCKLALVVNQLANRGRLILLPNEQSARAVLALPFER